MPVRRLCMQMLDLLMITAGILGAMAEGAVHWCFFAFGT